MDFEQEMSDDESAVGTDSSVASIASDVGVDDDLDGGIENPNGEVAVAVCEPEETSSSNEETSSSDEEEEAEPQEIAAAEPPKKKKKGEATIHKRGSRKLENGSFVRKEPPTRFKKRAVLEWKRLKALPENIDTNGGTKRGTFVKLQDWTKTIEQGHFIVHRKNQLDEWADLIATGKLLRGKRRADGRNGNVSPVAAMETILLEIIRTRRGLNAFLSRSDLLAKARELLAKPEVRNLCHQDTITIHWFRRFMQRHGLAMKSVKRMTLHSPERVAQLAQGFHLYVHRVLQTGLISWIVNFDEVPMSLLGSMGKLRTITFQSDKDVRCNVDPNDTKRCCTVIMGFGFILATGRSFPLPPIILLKGTPKTDRILTEKYHPGCSIAWTPKGVVTAVVMREVVVPLIAAVIKKEVGEQSLGMLVFDQARGHISETVKSVMSNLRLQPCIVPAGCTSWLQHVDTHVVAKYRAHHQELFMAKGIVKRSSRQKRSLLSELVVNSMIETAKSMNVEKAFRDLGYIDPVNARIRNIPYTFQPPVLTLADEESDKEKLQRIIQAEVAAAAAVPAAPKKVSKQMAGLAASAAGTRSLFSMGFTRRPLFAPPPLEILTQAPFDAEELIGANEQTQQQ